MTEANKDEPLSKSPFQQLVERRWEDDAAKALIRRQFGIRTGNFWEFFVLG